MPFGKRPLRTFALVIALPAFLLYVLSATLVIVALGGMAREIDRIEGERGVTSMHAALDSFLNDLSSAVSDEGTWDEAYLNVVITPDPAWMDTTWGATARLGQSYDNVLVTDQAGEIVFGENAVGAISGNIVSRYPAARTMLRNLDKGIAATTDATTLSRFAADPDGTVGLAAISIHRTTPGQMAVPRQARRILWLGRHLTPAMLQEIAVRYQTPMATMTGATDPELSSIALLDADGNVAGAVAWTPDRPGVVAFNHAVIVATLVFFVIGLVLVFGLGLLRRAMMRRAGAIASAHIAAIEAVAAPTAGGALPRNDLDQPDEIDPDLNSPIDGITAASFIIEYQPIFDLRAETMIGVEALLRWTRPDGSLLLQETMAPADRARLLDRVGPLAVRHATGDVAPLLGLILTLAVAPAQLRNSVFVEKIAGTLGATGFPARRLQLALDCPSLPDPALLHEPITELRRRGVLIALSEFAVTDLTAGYLDAALIDRVRLAASLTGKAGGGAAGDSYLAASVETARAAGVAIAVPGVERKDQAARLLRLGCREFQGELLAKPMPIAALTQLALAPARPVEVKRAS